MEEVRKDFGILMFFMSHPYSNIPWPSACFAFEQIGERNGNAKHPWKTVAEA